MLTHEITVTAHLHASQKGVCGKRKVQSSAFGKQCPKYTRAVPVPCGIQHFGYKTTHIATTPTVTTPTATTHTNKVGLRGRRFKLNDHHAEGRVWQRMGKN
ncbi:unnamed protein product [Notodromas monacha]|uniref:Uncharacterized protein n=1 Tax=Notodromas monacha TaxID=399045 RepID=A0A7R9GFH0_9CRUS|nr:unnamed protein product [Notodromas monacha]CAG0919342.1 unnamed protein product [Notodromas monacha]